ncbi:CPBP family intramembrane glutamic endopeptidase [Microbacterium sp. NPDC058062]|uniref:CPBP family intramembrane glutamic endopeptidase n=1 Tax=Microbacterium sp. NPDC058062 TaxID=3346320 RepID=UPI0036DDF06D
MSIRDTPFVQDAATGKRVTRWWIAYPLVLVGMIFIVQFGLMGVFELTLHPEPGSPEAQWLEIPAGLIPTALIILWVVLFERRHIKTMGFRRPGRGVLLLLLGIPIGALIISAPILLLWATGNYRLIDPPAGTLSGSTAALLVLVLVLTHVVQGGNEEVLIRSFLMQNSALQMPGWLAIVLPALLFTLMHGVLTKPLGFTTIMMYAIFAAFIVLWQNSLWLIIGIHGGWNWAEGNVWGVQVDGINVQKTGLIFLEPTEGAPVWVTGGGFGPEGGVIGAAWLVVLAGLAYLLYRNGRRRGARAAPATTTPAESVPKP